MYEFLKTLHPGGIRTRDLLFYRRTRWPLCHAARASHSFFKKVPPYTLVGFDLTTQNSADGPQDHVAMSMFALWMDGSKKIALLKWSSVCLSFGWRHRRHVSRRQNNKKSLIKPQRTGTGLPDLSCYNVPKRGKIYVPNSQKIYPMAIKYTKWL
jgi:hypothetical protein